ncbi:MAG: outer membrane protein W, partial [Myxococcota bacterium]
MGLRGVAEQWSDTSISSAYTQGAPIGAVGLGVPITDRLWVDVEVGYRRLNTETDETLSFSLIPASIVAEWSFGQGRARPFLAAGPTLTAF